MFAFSLVVSGLLASVSGLGDDDWVTSGPVGGPVLVMGPLDFLRAGFVRLGRRTVGVEGDTGRLLVGVLTAVGRGVFR